MKAVMLYLFTVSLAPAWGQTPSPPLLTPEQRTVIKKTVQFLKDAGETQRAQDLEDGIATPGNITFGPTQNNALATCDVTDPKRPIRINPDVIQHITPGTLESWKQSANLANTLCHELVHRGQDSNAWRGSFWQEQAFLGNPCEQQAWATSLEKWQQWLLKEHANMQGKANSSSAERANAARRLQMLCEAYSAQRNDYLRESRTNGLSSLTHVDGTPMTLADLDGQIATIRKHADDELELARALSGGGYSGLYQADFNHPASGRLALKVEGFTVSGQLRGQHQGDPFQADVQGRLDTDGNLQLEFSGTILTRLRLNGKVLYPDREPTKDPFSGQITGVVLKNKTMQGKWSARAHGEMLSGTWSGQRRVSK